MPEVYLLTVPPRFSQATLERDVCRDYDRMADLYAERFADVAVAHPLDRVLFGLFADLVRRDGGTRVADLGCGPGHWSGHLADAGFTVTGLDLSPALLDHAHRARPDLAFARASMARLPFRDGGLDGAVAWFSLIHTPPEDLLVLVDEAARVLAPGGRLLVGFPTTAADVTAVECFDHKVTAAWRWPVEALADVLRRAGLVVTARSVREPEGAERHRQAALIARRD